MKILKTISEKKNSPSIGGKALNLTVLEELNFKTPNWVVIPQEILLSQLSKDNKWSDSIQVPVVVMEELRSFFGSDYQAKTYAVRSSAKEEDGEDFSFAGQFDTFLHVPFSKMEEKIIACWKSTQSKRVKEYRKQNNLPVSFGIGVIIQEMIEPEVSGVAFGINPMTGIPNSKVINSVYGLGEGLVSGELNGDTYSIIGKEIKPNLTKKIHFFGRNKEKNGIEKIEVAQDKQNCSSLSDFQLKQIIELLDKLANHFGEPQDVEFAFEKDTLYTLQTRPITSFANKGNGEYTVWDNSNIIESYPGITTPLTYSFILKMYEMVYRQFVGMMGVRKNEIENNKEVFENTLGLVRGRVYYNLLNWYKMLAMVPGYSINAENMERMMGVKEKFELHNKYKMSKLNARFRVGIMGLKMIRLHQKLPRERKRFQRYLNLIIKEYQEIDFSKLSSHEIIDKYLSFETNLLLKWKAPLTNDFFAMIWFGILEKQAQKHFPNHPTIHNDLLCDSNDIISVEPIHRTIDICESIRKGKKVKELFLNQEKEQVWEVLTQGEFPDIKLEIDTYISQFGNRCIGELKLETISYSQNPSLFIGVIQSYLNQGISTDSLESKSENSLKIEATKLVNNTFKNKPIKKWVFNFCLKKTRDLVSNRENLRYERTRGFGMVRIMFSHLGKKWKEEGKLEDERDVFYLELAEIKQLKNTPFDQGLKQKVKERKEEFSLYKTQNPPMERFYSFGNEFTDEFIYSEEKTEGAEKDLKGIGCCPGIIEGKVRVVDNPEEIDSLNGDILVTSSTDPGWVTLFPTASAILVERGSLLSHSAIVSREMGIPCIVSITGLLRTLKTGDFIQMNGSTGEIELRS